MTLQLRADKISKLVRLIDELQCICDLGVNSDPWRVLQKLDECRMNMPPRMVVSCNWRMTSALAKDEAKQLSECDRRSKELVSKMRQFWSRELDSETHRYLDNYLELTETSVTKKNLLELNSPEFWERQFTFMKWFFPLCLAVVVWTIFGLELRLFPVILMVVASIGAISLGIIGVYGKRLVHPEFDSIAEWLGGVPLFTLMKLFSPQLWVVSLILSLVFWIIQK
jgi:hypothetical protein